MKNIRLKFDQILLFFLCLWNRFQRKRIDRSIIRTQFTLTLRLFRFLSSRRVERKEKNKTSFQLDVGDRQTIRLSTIVSFRSLSFLMNFFVVNERKEHFWSTRNKIVLTSPTESSSLKKMSYSFVVLFNGFFIDFLYKWTTADDNVHPGFFFQSKSFLHWGNDFPQDSTTTGSTEKI